MKRNYTGDDARVRSIFGDSLDALVGLDIRP
jgi:hypothetical protein